jgi:lipooligosaccharide transport system permease protein
MMLLHFHKGILPLYKKVLRQEGQGWINEVLTTLAIPLTFFLAFGLGLREYIADVHGVPYMVFISPGLISMTILLEAYRTGAWGLWLDRWHQGMIDEYRIKPITTSDIIVGEILGGFTVALIKGAIVAIILLLMTPISVSLLHLVPYLTYMFLGSILFTCVGTMVGTYFAKPDQIAQTQTIVITPLLYLGGLFFPIDAFPKEILPIVRWLPTTALFDGGRAALLSGTHNVHYLAILLVSAFVSFFGATYLFNRKLSE